MEQVINVLPYGFVAYWALLFKWSSFDSLRKNYSIRLTIVAIIAIFSLTILDLLFWDPNVDGAFNVMRVMSGYCVGYLSHVLFFKWSDR